MVEGSGTSVAPEKHKKKDAADNPNNNHKPEEDTAHRLSHEGNTQARPGDGKGNGQGARQEGRPDLPQVTIDQGGDKQPHPTEKPPEAAATRKLDDETIKKYADELHEAVTRTSWLGLKNNPDNEKIQQLLSSLTEADRKALETAYINAKGNDVGHSLRDDLRERLDDEAFRKAENRLNTKDGRTNDAGNLMEGLTAINGNRADGERRVLETFATLNSEQRKLMSEDFQRDYGMSVEQALQQYGVSEDSMKALSFINKPIDQRTAQEVADFARFAVEKKNLDYLAVALRGDTPAAVEARKMLQQDEQFMKNVVEAFNPEPPPGGLFAPLLKTADVLLGPVDEFVSGVVNGDLSWGKVLGGIPVVEAWNDFMSVAGAKNIDANLMSALDLVRDGRVSLGTIALNNSGSLFGWFDNKENTKLAVDNASQKERDVFKMGYELSQSGRSPETEEQKNALAFYQRMHQAFENSGDKREQALWESTLMYGKDSVQAKMANAQNSNERFTALESMSEDDWKKLHDPEKGPAARQELDRFLSRFVDDGNERARLMQIAEAKAGKETFEASQTARRTLSEVIEHNKGSVFLGMGTKYDGKNIANAVASMSPEEALRYKSEPAFKAELDKFIQDNLGENEKRYAEQLLRQVASTGKSPEIGPAEKVLQNNMNGVEPKAALSDIEKLLHDPETRKRLSGDVTSMTPEDKALRQTIDDVMNRAIFSSPEYQASMYDESGRSQSEAFDRLHTSVYKHLWEKGTLAPDVKAELNLKNEKFYEEVGKLPQAERQALYQAHNISKDEQSLIEVIAKQDGKLMPEDRIRAFVLGNGASADEFKGMLREMSGDQKQQLKDGYAQKYGKPLEEDFLGKVDKKDQQLFKNLLTPGELDGRQDYYDNLEEHLRSRSGGGLAPDATSMTVERAMHDNAALHQWFNHQFEKMPPEIQQAANEYFKEALEQHKESKAKMAELIATIAITAAALAATPFTGGASLALVASIAFVAGGVAKVAIHRAVEGGDYDWNKALGNFVGGGVEGALNMLGGKIVEGLFKGFNVAGKTFASNLMKEGLATADEAVVGKAFTELMKSGGKEVSEEALAKFASTVAPGAGEAQAALIKQMAQRAIAQNYDEILNRATRVALGGVDNAMIGGAAADVQLVVNGVINGRPVTAEELLNSFLIGAATGAVVGTVIRGAIEGRDIYVAAKKAANGDVVIMPSKPGDAPVKIKGADGQVREVTGETTLKPGETVVDGPQPAPEIMRGADTRFSPQYRPGDTVMSVDGKPYKNYQLTGADGNPITIDNNKMTIGRSKGSDIRALGDEVSGYHAQIEFTPDGPRLNDLHSTNGTYINGEKLPTDGHHMLKPGDRIRLGEDGPEYVFGESYKPDAYREHALEINGRNIPLDKEKITFGRLDSSDVKFDHGDVSRHHAELEFTSEGPILRDVGSTNGTYVNGEPISGPVKLKPGDRVHFGDESASFVFRDNKFHTGDINAPREVQRYNPGQADNAARPEAVAQSNRHKDGWEMREPIEDGFQMVGGDTRIQADGNWHDPHRPATVVDRTQDAVLNETIREAHQRFDRIAKQIRNAQSTAEREALQMELAAELAKYSKNKMHPQGWTENQVDAAYYAFRSDQANQRILLGDFIEQAARGEGAGVCQHQALLFKVLADDFGLDTAIVAGHSGVRPPGGFPAGHRPNHAWNEVYIGDERFVFDPRQQYHGNRYDELPYHTPARDFGPPQAQAIRPQDVNVQRGMNVEHEGGLWQVDSFNTSNGDVVLTHPAQRPVTRESFEAVNQGRQLEVGQRYKVERSNGAVEEGWRYDGVNNDGTLRFYKEDGLRVEVKRTDLAADNPHLVRGRNNGEVMSGPRNIDKELQDAGISPANLSSAKAAYNELVAAGRGAEIDALLAAKAAHRDLPIDVNDILYAQSKLRGIGDPAVRADAEQLLHSKLASLNEHLAADPSLDKIRTGHANRKLAEAVDYIESVANGRLHGSRADEVLALIRAASDAADVRIPVHQLADATPESMQFYSQLVDHASSSPHPDHPGTEGFKSEAKAGLHIQEALAKNADLNDWVFVPAGHNSPADGMGIDGVFVNVKSNEMVPVDLGNSNKRVLEKATGDNGKKEARLWPMLEPRNDGQAADVTRRFLGIPDHTGTPRTYVVEGQLISPPRLPLNTFDGVPGHATGAEGDLLFPSFRSVMSDQAAQGIAARSGNPVFTSAEETARFIEATRKRLNGPPAMPDGPARTTLEKLEKLARNSLHHRTEELNFAQRLREDLDNAVAAQAANGRGLVEVGKPEVVRPKFGEHEGAKYMELGATEKVGGFQSIRVYENGTVSGVKLARNHANQLVETEVQIGHIRTLLENTPNVGGRIPDAELNRIIDSIPEKFDFDPGRGSVTYQNSDALQAVARAFNPGQSVPIAGPNAMNAFDNLERVRNLARTSDDFRALANEEQIALARLMTETGTASPEQALQALRLTQDGKQRGLTISNKDAVDLLKIGNDPDELFEWYTTYGGAKGFESARQLRRYFPEAASTVDNSLTLAETLLKNAPDVTPQQLSKVAETFGLKFDDALDVVKGKSTADLSLAVGVKERAAELGSPRITSIDEALSIGRSIGPANPDKFARLLSEKLEAIAAIQRQYGDFGATLSAQESLDIMKLNLKDKQVKAAAERIRNYRAKGKSALQAVTDVKEGR